MADIPSEENRIQTAETKFRAAVAESTLTRIGASINWLLDQFALLNQKTLKSVIFDSTQSYEIPANVYAVKIIGCGGGGGGGFTVSGGSSGIGGGGGAGAPVHELFLPVVPGQIFNITIGAGGAAGANGNISIIQSGDIRFEFPAGRGTTTSTGAVGSVGAVNPFIPPLFFGGGAGGNGNGSGVPDNGDRTPFALGGPSACGASQCRGGGGASLGRGGSPYGGQTPLYGGGGGGFQAGAAGRMIFILDKI